MSIVRERRRSTSPANCSRPPCWRYPGTILDRHVLVAVDDPDAFTADTSTARLVRQIISPVSELEKASLVAKLKGTRDRKSAGMGRR